MTSVPGDETAAVQLGKAAIDNVQKIAHVEMVLCAMAKKIWDNFILRPVTSPCLATAAAKLVCFVYNRDITGTVPWVFGTLPTLAVVRAHQMPQNTC